MKNDFDLIVHKFDRGVEEIRIYPLGDVHIGSQEFNESQWKKWKKLVMDDENGYIIILGDMMDNGLKNSKTNSYEATMRPQEQQQWLINELRPLTEKIIGIVDGNHEYRSARDSDISPLYNVMQIIGLDHLYRENACFIKINVGEKRADRQYAYTMVGMHGATKTKAQKFPYYIDGADIFISGHTHTAEQAFPMKLVIDPRNECVREVGMKRIVVPAFLEYGGYGLKGMYQPSDNSVIPIVKLSGTEKKITTEWV